MLSELTAANIVECFYGGARCVCLSRAVVVDGTTLPSGARFLHAGQVECRSVGELLEVVDAARRDATGWFAMAWVEQATM